MRVNFLLEFHAGFSKTLACCGRVEAHGMAVALGSTAVELGKKQFAQS